MKNNKLSQKIKYLRNRKNITLKELGHLLGVSTQTIFKYENDIIKNIKYETIEKMAEIFEVTPHYLLGLEENFKESKAKFKEILKNDIINFFKAAEVSFEEKEEIFKHIQELYFEEKFKLKLQLETV